MRTVALILLVLFSLAFVPWPVALLFGAVALLVTKPRGGAA